MQPPTTVSKAPTDLETPDPFTRRNSRKQPPPLEDTPICTGTHGPKQGKCWETSSR